MKTGERMTNHASVTEWIISLRHGSSRAAQEIWERYYGQLMRIANQRLGDVRRRAADEEDVVQEAFASFFRSVQAGRFPQLDDRDDLWQILLMLTDRRAKDRMRKELAEIRGGGDVRGESVFLRAGEDSSDGPGLNRVEGYEPTPETVDALLDFLRARWGTFQDETLSEIALDKLQGYSNTEIAEKHSMALRSVERKLQLIRRLLTQEA